MGQTGTRTVAPGCSALADHVTGLAEQAFDAADRLRRHTEDHFAAVRGTGRAPTSADLAAIRPQATAALAGLITGAGVITTPLVDGRPGLEWWMQTGPTERSRLDLDLDPSSEGFVDVGNQQWFAVPRDTGKRHVTGPYVDYVCAEQYLLTFTVPVSGDTGFAGIAGADIFVADFERALRPALRAAGAPVAVVNAHGRIIAGSAARHRTGSLIREPDIRTALAQAVPQTLADGVVLLPCGTLPMAVLTWP